MSTRMRTMDASKFRTSDRFTELKGSINFRDFGGYPTEDGKFVKKGLLFRCGALTDIPKSAYSDFSELNIGVICDLRSHAEAEEMPTPDAPPFSCRVHIPIWPGSSAQFRESLNEQRPTASDFIKFMQNVTRDIARDHVDAYKELANHLLATDQAFLLHCSAGKDRTGFGAAIILKTLGVNQELIFEDYLISNQAAELKQSMKVRMLEQAKAQGAETLPDDQVIDILASVRREYLEGAFQELYSHYGSIEGYLEAIGLDGSAQEHLRDRLLD